MKCAPGDGWCRREVTLLFCFPHKTHSPHPASYPSLPMSWISPGAVFQCLDLMCANWKFSSCVVSRDLSVATVTDDGINQIRDGAWSLEPD